MLTGVLKVLIKNLFYENFDTTLMGKWKKLSKHLLFFSHKNFL